MPPFGYASHFRVVELTSNSEPGFANVDLLTDIHLMAVSGCRDVGRPGAVQSYRADHAPGEDKVRPSNIGLYLAVLAQWVSLFSVVMP